MPYESKAQAAYMHIHHPEITAKWKEEGHGYVKRKKRKGQMVKVQHVSKAKLKDIGTSAIEGGQIALDARTQGLLKARKRKKGRVKKMLVTSPDPYFNQAAAQKAFDLVMKMDLDTAEMFTFIVASDLFEETVEKNLGSLQQALDKSIERRTEMLKRALIRTAQSTSDPQVVEYAKALRELEEITKAEPHKYNNIFREADVRRDPSGRFAVEVRRTMDKPLKKEVAEQVIGSYGSDKITDDKTRARYQDEYRQVSAFLAGVQNISGGPGNVDVIYHQQDKAGNRFSVLDNSGRVPTEMLEEEDTQLIGIEAKPTTLTAGGAAYGLMGGLTGDQVRRTNLAGELSQPSVQNWAAAGREQEQTSRTFQRLQTTGNFLNQVGAPGSQVQMAGKFAEIVGQYGPQAEEVMGPAARKTAYRYRGTEKAPEKLLVDTYGREIQDAKVYGVAEEEEMDRRLLGFGTKREQARGDFVPMAQRRATGAREPRGQVVTPAIGQMGQRREGLLDREPTWPERGAGAALVADFLRKKLPDKHLYRLHLEAGNTPPSEGVIINDKGQLAVQAVGYGDDHYLPFNLKNLKSLKGGEYIRNRSVGGPSSEDVYTGLVGGARRMTVVSRSGTFTVEFNEDFRGGRRHNDKARRMTRRYEQLLDAVQSGKVDRQSIPKRWRTAIENEVKADYPNQNRAVIRELTDDRIKEFKENPQIEGRDLDRAEAMISEMEQRALTGEVSEKDVTMFRREIMNELHNMKEVRFRLNGIGYEAALKSLQEQFPYYIKSVKTNPTRDEEQLEFELDEGYVEPGRNRPTKARAGLHGTKENPSEKFSASQADYQRGRTGKGAFKPIAGSAAAAATTPQAGAPSGRTLSDTETRERDALRRKDAFARQAQVEEAKSAAVKMRQVLIAGQPVWENQTPPAWMSMKETQFKAEMNDPTKEEAFYQEVARNASVFEAAGSGIRDFAPTWQKYKEARAVVNQEPFKDEFADQFPPVPFSFPDEKKPAYHAGAKQSEIAREIADIDKHEAMFTTTKLASEMNDAEMEKELNQTKFLRDLVANDTESDTVESVLADHHRVFPNSAPVAKLTDILSNEKKTAQHKKNLHKVRYLHAMEKYASGPPEAGSQGGGGGPAAGGGGGSSQPSSGQGPATSGQPAKPLPPPPTGGQGAKAPQARMIRLNGAERAIKELNTLMNEQGTTGAQRSKYLRDKNAIEAFKTYLDKNKSLVDSAEIDKEMDIVLDDDQKQRVSGIFSSPSS